MIQRLEQGAYPYDVFAYPRGIKNLPNYSIFTDALLGRGYRKRTSPETLSSNSFRVIKAYQVIHSNASEDRFSFLLALSTAIHNAAASIEARVTVVGTFRGLPEDACESKRCR